MVVNHMAAGGHCVSKRREFYSYSKDDHGHYKNGSYHGVGSIRCRDHNGRHKDGHCISSNQQNFDHRQGGPSARMEVQDHSDWRDGGRIREASRVKHDEMPNCEDGIQLPPQKKRKFSPIIWDIEETKVRVASKHRIVPSRNPQSPPNMIDEVLNVLSDESLAGYAVLASQIKRIELPSVKSHVPSESTITTVSGSPVISSLSLPANDQQSVLDEEECGQARNIALSRWATDGHSYIDLSISAYEDECRMHEQLYNAISSRRTRPETGEFWKEGTEANRVRSSGSDRQCSEDESFVNGLRDNDAMDVDMICAGNNADSQLDSDVEFDCDSCLAEEHLVPNKRMNMLQGCRSVFEYDKLNKINEGTYGIVYRARDRKTGEIVALKKVKMDVDNNAEYGFPLSALREINVLMSFQHPSIVNVKEVVVDDRADDLDNVFMVMEYMEHDLKGLMEVMKQPFSTSEVKCLMLQLLEGVKSLHDNWVLHRDLKTSNLLLNNQGELKVCDFGLSRQYGSSLKTYTTRVVTQWYRAPELLLGAKQYSTAVDMWSVGCIMAELLAKETLFKGKSEIEQLNKIFTTLGTPNETIWPGLSQLPGVKANFLKQPFNMLRKKFPAASFTGSPALSDLGFDLLNRLLTYDPEKRITADAALSHDWFREVPLAKSKEFMPTFPARHVKNK